MVKAEKAGLGRRLQAAGAHSAASVGSTNSVVVTGANGSNQQLVHEFGAACDQKNVATSAAVSGTCVIQANVTPIRSMSMREKRLAELENGSNSLPRTYAGRCTSCTYCSAVVTSCSPCCLSAAPMNVCPNYYVKVIMPIHFNFHKAKIAFLWVVVAVHFHAAYSKQIVGGETETDLESERVGIVSVKYEHVGFITQRNISNKIMAFWKINRNLFVFLAPLPISDFKKL